VTRASAVEVRRRQVWWARVLGGLLSVFALATAALRLWSASLLHQGNGHPADPYDGVQTAWRLAAPVTIALHLAWTNARRPLTEPLGSAVEPSIWAVRRSMPLWIRWTPEWLGAIGLFIFNTGGVGFGDTVSPIPTKTSEAVTGSIIWAVAFLLVPVRVVLLSRHEAPVFAPIVPGMSATATPSPVPTPAAAPAPVPHEPGLSEAAVTAGELFGSLLVLILAIGTAAAMVAAYVSGAQPLTTSIVVVGLSVGAGGLALVGYRRARAHTR
jgi:hypothetical protein